MLFVITESAGFVIAGCHCNKINLFCVQYNNRPGVFTVARNKINQVYNEKKLLTDSPVAKIYLTYNFIFLKI